MNGQAQNITAPICSYRLDQYAVVAVSGRDAVAFLNRQLTCDVNAISSATTGFGAWCTPKGRIITLFYVLKRPTGLCLVTSAELVDFTLNRMRMYVMRDDVKFSLTQEQIQGLILDPELENFDNGEYSLPVPEKNYQTVHANNISIIRWPASNGCGPRVMLIGNRNALDITLPTQCAFQTRTKWQLEDIRSGIPEVTQATREAFIPQMLNLERLGGVSFAKGCYPGQEIVARTQHLGRIKRRMYIGSVDSVSQQPFPGDQLLTKQGERVGRIVSSTKNADHGCAMLVVVPLAKATQSLFVELTPSQPQISVTLTVPGYGFEDVPT